VEKLNKNAAPDRIPQIMAIAPVSRDGKVTLKKKVRDYLGTVGRDLYLDVRQEILLTTRKSAASKPAEMQGNRLLLPGEILTELELEKGALLAMIQRKGAVALKKMEIEEREGDSAEVIDVETARQVARVAWTNPMPEKLLPELRARYGDLAFKHDARAFLQGQRTLDAWKARKRIGMVEAGDDALREELIQARLDAQQEDGSWQGDIVLTARNLRELADLGLPPDADEMRKAAMWLLKRPQSPWNPGMFFATDQLVAEQASVVGRRKEGTQARFRQLKTSEKKRVMAGDDMICAPCGPRIMWPNALVLEALLYLGYEEHDRVQMALGFMVTHDWCECAYQHGLSSWRRTEPLTMDEIERFEADCIAEYRYGGIPGIGLLHKMDLTVKVGPEMPRVAHRAEQGADTFSMEMPTHIQGCEMITTRAMSRVTNAKVRRFAQAHLWRFASRQHASNGQFAKEKYGGGFPQAGLLQVFARYDHPASKVVIMRSLPWIVDAQNEDGSWGEEPYKDAATHAVLQALVSVGDCLPPGLVP
jgi:hypothetical protein